MVGKCTSYPFQADHRQRAPLLSIQYFILFLTKNRHLAIYCINKSDNLNTKVLSFPRSIKCINAYYHRAPTYLMANIALAMQYTYL